MTGPMTRSGALSRLVAASLTCAALGGAAAPAPARADPFEVRTYLDVSKGWALGGEGDRQAAALRLAPFVREESRFRQAGLGYVKTFAGLRMASPAAPWLSAAVYYAHKDMILVGKPQGHLAVLDVFLAPKVGPLVLWDKSGLEAHVSDGFFRYRNALELRWETPLRWLAPFARAELRVDSDAGRVNLFDGWLGLVLRVPTARGSRLSMRLFYGYEGNRRGKPGWSGVSFLGAALGATL